MKKKQNKGPKLDLKSILPEDMTRIPHTEQDLPVVPVCIDMTKKVRVDQFVKVSDIKHEALQLVFEKREDAAIKVIDRLGNESKWEGEFQYDILMVFWLCIHMGNRKLLNRIMIYDVYLRQLVTLAVQKKQEHAPKSKRSAVGVTAFREDGKHEAQPEAEKTAGKPSGKDVGGHHKSTPGLLAPPNGKKANQQEHCEGGSEEGTDGMFDDAQGAQGTRDANELTPSSDSDDDEGEGDDSERSTEGSQRSDIDWVDPNEFEAASAKHGAEAGEQSEAGPEQTVASDEDAENKAAKKQASDAPPIRQMREQEL